MVDGTPNVPRIEPIPLREWPPEMREALAALTPPVVLHPFVPGLDRPKALNALGTLAHYPALTRAFHCFNGHIIFASSLAPRERELLVLRVAFVRGSDYEWAQHAVLAAQSGLSAAEIERVKTGPADPSWQPADRALVTAVDELLSDAMVSDQTWEALGAHLDTHQLMDLVFTVGAYDALAMALRTFGVQLDDELARYAPQTSQDS